MNTNKLRTPYLLVPFLLILLFACSGNESETESKVEKGLVDDQRIINAPLAEPGSWLTYGQTYKEQRFSTLSQINKENVEDLGLAWHKAIGGSTERMQGTPLVVDGVMYVSSHGVAGDAFLCVKSDIQLKVQQLGPSLSKFAQFGPSWSKLAQVGTSWSKFVEVGRSWSKLPIWANLHQLGSAWINFCQLVPTWTTLCQI